MAENFPPWDVVKGAIGDALALIRREIEGDYTRKFALVEARLAALESAQDTLARVQQIHDRTTRALDERAKALDRLESKLSKLDETMC
jgi:hypothetical protein